MELVMYIKVGIAHIVQKLHMKLKSRTALAQNRARN